MSDITTFKAAPRAKAGKGPNRAVRRTGRIPGVIYGGKQDPEMISLDLPEVIRAHSTGKMMSRVCDVEVGGKKTRAIPREVQVEPVRDTPVHVDFLRLVPGIPVAINVPVEFLRADASPGIKRGGVLNIVRHEIELLVDPDHIPDHIEADLTGLEINDSLHISAMTLPPGATPTIKRNFTVATIVAPSGRAEEAAEAAAKAAAAAAAAATAEGAPAEGAAAGAAPAEGEKKAEPEKKAGDDKKK